MSQVKQITAAIAQPTEEVIPADVRTAVRKSKMITEIGTVILPTTIVIEREKLLTTKQSAIRDVTALAKNSLKIVRRGMFVPIRLTKLQNTKVRPKAVKRAIYAEQKVVPTIPIIMLHIMKHTVTAMKRAKIIR